MHFKSHQSDATVKPKEVKRSLSNVELFGNDSDGECIEISPDLKHKDKTKKPKLSSANRDGKKVTQECVSSGSDIVLSLSSDSEEGQEDEVLLISVSKTGEAESSHREEVISLI